MKWYQRLSTKFALVFYLSFVVTVLIFATLTIISARQNTFTSVRENLSHSAEFWENYLHNEFETNHIHHPSFSEILSYSNFYQTRLTLIDSTGKVIFDSDVDSSKLVEVENHISRPEIQQAIQETFGENIRHSATTNHDFYYFAKKLNRKINAESIGKISFIRIAYPLKSLSTFYTLYTTIVIGLSLVLLVAGFFLYKFLADRLTEPILKMVDVSKQITDGKIETRIQVSQNDELGILGNSINRMAEKLVEDIQKLKKLERVRSEFIANVSHELKTPIFTIQGFVETLLDGAIYDESVNRNFLNKILKNSLNLNNLVSDLIEISKIETGELKMSFRLISLEDLIDEVFEDLQAKADEKQIQLVKNLLQPNIRIVADRSRLQQVFTNLIDNAIKYSDNGKVTVTCDGSDSKLVTISVQDTGIGISEEHVSRIFERFYRIDKHRSKDAGGTGLGLAIVKHIIEAHGSKIIVESIVGSGTKFTFSISKVLT